MEVILVLMAGALMWVVWRWQAAERKYRVSEGRADGLEERLERQQSEIRGPDTAGMLGLVATDALLIADSDQRIQYLNPAARRLFEVPDTVGSGDSVIAITRHHELDDLIHDGLADDIPLVEPIEIRGQPFRAHVKRSGPADAPFVAVALEDIGELKRLSRARRDMVANISHDLRTPITSIRLLVDTLLRHTTDDRATIEGSLIKIGAQIDTLHTLAQELLDLSMIESGRVEFRMRPTDLDDVMDVVISDLGEITRSQKVTIQREIAPECRMLVDEGQIKRVMRNLLHNAIKFSPKGGTIWIDGRVDEGQVMVLITDDGPGIHPEEHTRIFERFFQSDTSRQGGGTGLGLAIVKHIVQAHGGEVHVGDVMDDSARHGLRGAQLIVSLPRAPEG